MPLDHPAPDLLSDLHALIEASAKLDRIAAQRAMTTRDLHTARTEARHALFAASSMTPDRLAEDLDSRITERPRAVHRARIAKASTTTLHPDRWTDALDHARNRLREAVCHALARLEGKDRPTS